MAQRTLIPRSADRKAVERRPADAVRPEVRSETEAISPELQLARAQRLGHRPAGLPAEGAGTVQRYTLVSSANVGAEQGAVVKTRDIARTRFGSAYSETASKANEEGTNPEAEVKTRDPVSGTSTRTGRLPDLRVSQSGTLAVPDSGQARNFYAEASTVDATNRVLSGSGSELRLLLAGRGLSVPSNPGDPSSAPRQLGKVHAAKQIPADALNAARVEIADAFDAMNCDDFIQLVLGAGNGASRRAVLENAEVGTQIPAQPGQEPVSQLARHLTPDQRPSLEEVAQGLSGPSPSQQDLRQGKIDYERLDAQERRNRAANIGINEFASPEVGEGFVIRSQETEALLNPGQDDRGYQEAIEELEAAEQTLAQGRRNVSARVQKMLRTWGEHYAGVIAKDGPDVVTLENYNRRAEVGWEHERIFNNLFRDFEEFRELVTGNVESLAATPDQATIQNLVQLAAQGSELRGEYQQALQEAQDSFTTGLALTQQSTYENFFFQMYGPGDQSFHSTYSGMASNPVTFRIREDPRPFADESRQAFNSFDTTVTQMQVAVQGHAVPGVTADLQLLLQQANLQLGPLRQDLLAATTRADYLSIDERSTAAKRVLRDGFFNRLSTAYRDITGNPFQGLGAGDLRTTVKDYVDSYYSFQKFTERYRSITALQALLTALTPSMP